MMQVVVLIAQRTKKLVGPVYVGRTDYSSDVDWLIRESQIGFLRLGMLFRSQTNCIGGTLRALPVDAARNRFCDSEMSQPNRVESNGDSAKMLHPTFTTQTGAA